MNEFTHVREVNVERCNVWHPRGINSWSPADWGIAVMGEAGEMCNVIKKLKRLEDGLGNKQGPHTREEAVAMLADEIADTFTYLDLLAASFGIDLLEAVRSKFNRISERQGLPHRL